MNEKSVTAMFGTMPIISMMMGLTILFAIYVNELFFQFTPLLLAILLVVLNIVMTGGLHLDGWIDLSDAYFSYRDRERRLEILSDSRVGAFGAISLVVMILLKVAFFYEVLIQHVSLVYFFFIPVLCRIAMLLYFSLTKNVKETGLAAYFKAQVVVRHLWVYIVLYMVFLITLSFVFKNMILFVLLLSMIVITFIYRKWTINHFGGMTGDLLGALYEGMELALWGILLLFI